MALEGSGVAGKLRIDEFIGRIKQSPHPGGIWDEG